MDARELRRHVVILLLQLAVTVLVTVVPDWGQFNFTKADEVLFGASLFIAFLLLDLLWVTNKLAARAAHEDSLRLLREDCDGDLENVSRSFVRLAREAYGNNDLFVGHFRQKIRLLAQTIAVVAERHEMRVQADHFLNVDNVLDAFQGDTERVWRYTWDVGNGNEQLFDELAWKRYFERTATMVGDGRISEIRTIIVVDEAAAATTRRIEILLGFFKTNPGYSCCIVRRMDFQKLCVDSGLDCGCVDFGIYGTRLLFITEQYEPNVIGVFTKDPTLIERYSRLFDSMWDSPSVARRNPYQAGTRVTLDELYALDES